MDWLVGSLVFMSLIKDYEGIWMKQIKYIPKKSTFWFHSVFKSSILKYQSVMYSKMWLCVNIYMLHVYKHYIVSVYRALTGTSLFRGANWHKQPMWLFTPVMYKGHSETRQCAFSLYLTLFCKIQLILEPSNSRSNFLSYMLWCSVIQADEQWLCQWSNII